jgi:hypothetical protein
MMNERIKELAEQAQQYAEHVTPQGLEWFDTFKEKFAELIVKECGNVVFNYTNKTETHELYDDVGWDCLPGDLKIQIEEHFGFE